MEYGFSRNRIKATLNKPFTAGADLFSVAYSRAMGGALRLASHPEKGSARAI